LDSLPAEAVGTRRADSGCTAAGDDDVAMELMLEETGAQAAAAVVSERRSENAVSG